MSNAKNDLEPIARLLQHATNTAWSLALQGTPRSDDAYKHMGNIKPGDMVMETSTALMQSRPALDGIGELLRVVQEDVPFDDWNVDTDGPIPKERVYYIKTLDGREFRWTNATFVKVPDYFKLNNIVPRPAPPHGEGDVM